MAVHGTFNTVHKHSLTGCQTVRGQSLRSEKQKNNVAEVITNIGKRKSSRLFSDLKLSLLAILQPLEHSTEQESILVLI